MILALLLAAAQPVTLSDAIEICRMTYFINPAKGKMMFDAVPEDQKATVAAICLSYRQGVLDLIEVSKKPRPPEQVSWAR